MRVQGSAHAFQAADETEFRRILKFIKKKDFATADSLIAGRPKHGEFNDKELSERLEFYQQNCIAKCPSRSPFFV